MSHGSFSSNSLSQYKRCAFKEAGGKLLSASVYERKCVVIGARRFFELWLILYVASES